MIDGKCNKCGTEKKILKTHVGKKHKKCQGRKPGDSKFNCGKWEAK